MGKTLRGMRKREHAERMETDVHASKRPFLQPLEPLLLSKGLYATDWLAPPPQTIEVQVASQTDRVQSARETSVVMSVARSKQPKSAKMKIQLFPLDDHTMHAVSQFGMNPFLELTLKAGKSVASVVKHLHGKWKEVAGSIHEMKLLPYRVNSISLQDGVWWTVRDEQTTVDEIRRLAGSEEVLRLRYMWEPEPILDPYAQNLPIVGSETPAQNAAWIIPKADGPSGAPWDTQQAPLPSSTQDDVTPLVHLPAVKDGDPLHEQPHADLSKWAFNEDSLRVDPKPSKEVDERLTFLDGLPSSHSWMDQLFASCDVPRAEGEQGRSGADKQQASFSGGGQEGGGPSAGAPERSADGFWNLSLSLPLLDARPEPEVASASAAPGKKGGQVAVGGHHSSVDPVEHVTAALADSDSLGWLLHVHQQYGGLSSPPQEGKRTEQPVGVSSVSTAEQEMSNAQERSQDNLVKEDSLERLRWEDTRDSPQPNFHDWNSVDLSSFKQGFTNDCPVEVSKDKNTVLGKTDFKNVLKKEKPVEPDEGTAAEEPHAFSGSDRSSSPPSGQCCEL